MPEPGPRFPGRLPQAFGWSEMQKVAKRNGMSDVQAAALIGAHTLGGCHPTVSGYQGTWDNTPFKFDEHFWLALLDAQWFTKTVVATNDQTGEQTVKEQFALEDFFDSSVMLFSDMGSHVDLSKCDVGNEDVSKGLCPPNNNPTALPNILRAWADRPETFFSAFARAWFAMSGWGCTNCYNVTEYDGDPITCDSFYNPPACKPYFKEPYSVTPGWSNYHHATKAPTPAPTTYAPTTTQRSYPLPPTPAPTTPVRRYYLEKENAGEK
jgi:hypothetical protein